MNAKLSKQSRKQTLYLLENSPELHDLKRGNIRLSTGQVINPVRSIYQKIKEELK